MRKIILSRKGFDSSNGGCPSPILPDGTLLSMPIPSGDKMCYRNLRYNGINYADLLEQLHPGTKYSNCHLDPDIRDGIRVESINDWKPAFGQKSTAQKLLSNSGVDKGDIFLFFGWFKQTKEVDGKYRFVCKNDDFYRSSDLQVIYGYLEVEKVLTKADEMRDYSWHPHTSYTDDANVLYIPTKSFSLYPDMPGCGTLDFRTDRVLTMEGKSRAVWNDHRFLAPEHICGQKRKNSAENGGLYYAGIWQELVFEETEELMKWVRSILI